MSIISDFSFRFSMSDCKAEFNSPILCILRPPSSLLSEAFSGPSNLQFTGQMSDSLRFRWNQAGGPVNGYAVQYVPLSGLGQPITAELRQVSPSV